MDDSYGLLKLQEANLKILEEIDRICEKYHIKYMLDAGTLIGAVRHGGFIPWDDDADIAMTRSNWEAFAKVADRELPDGMVLQRPDRYSGGKAFFDFTPRIIYEASRRKKPDEDSGFYNEVLNHLWVDIFILDKLPKGRCLSEMSRFNQKAIYLLAMGHRRKQDYKKYNLTQKICVAAGSTIGKLIPLKPIIHMQDKSAKAYRKAKADEYFYSNYQPDYLYVTLKSSWVEEVIKANFENTKLSIPKHYHEILTTVYGDYMTMPEKKDRKPTHGSTEIKIYD